MIPRLFRAAFALVAALSLLLGLGVGYASWQGTRTGRFFSAAAAFGTRLELHASSGRLRVLVVRNYPGRAFAFAASDDSAPRPRPQVFVDSFVPSRTEKLAWPRVTIRHDTRLAYRSADGGVAEFVLADLPDVRDESEVHRGLPAVTVSDLQPKWVVGGLLALPFAWAVTRAWAEHRRAARRKAGRCEHCGEDLGGTAGPCPACGRTGAAVTTAAPT